MNCNCASSNSQNNDNINNVLDDDMDDNITTTCKLKTTKTTTSTTLSSSLFEELVQLHSIPEPNNNNNNNTGRTIAYGIAGDLRHGTPIVVFPPLEGTRRMLLLLHDVLIKYSLKALCVNRPGIEGTSWASSSSSSNDNNDNVQNHVHQSCQDIHTVLRHLGWTKPTTTTTTTTNNNDNNNNNNNNKIGILCMCAGTPFALAFAAGASSTKSNNIKNDINNNYNNHINIGSIVCLAPWILPADCPYSKSLYQFAANYLHRQSIGYIIGSLSTFFMNYVLSRETIAMKLYQTSSRRQEQLAWKQKLQYLRNIKKNDNNNNNQEEEQTKQHIETDKDDGQQEQQQEFDPYELDPNEQEQLAIILDWALGSATGNSLDVAVCLSSAANNSTSTSTSTSGTLGFEYSQVTNNDITIYVGDSDHMTTVESAKWFAQQVSSSNKNQPSTITTTAFQEDNLTIVPQGTHNGALFLLGDDITSALQNFK